MQIECLRDTLLEKISLLQGAASKNLNLPILNNILIQTENGRIKLATTNLEIGMVAWIGGKITDNGEIAVPIKLLINVLSNISAEKVLLKTEKDSLIIEGEMFKTVIKGMSGKDFPIIPKIEGGIEFSLQLESFKKAISRTLFAISLNDMRPELTGILFEILDKNLNFVGTDSFRLSKTSSDFTFSSEKIDNLNIIIPSKTLSEVLKGAGKSEGSVLIRIADNQILFNLSNNIFIISRIIEGQYPPYGQIIPVKSNTKILLNKEELIKAVKMAGIFTSGKALEIILKQKDKDKIEIQSSSQDIGENFSLINAEIQGKKIENLTFNYRYLLEGVSAVDSEKVCFAINDENTPIIITSDKEGDKFLYLMMPLK